MSNLNQFFGGARPPTAIVNYSSVGGSYDAVPSPSVVKQILSGALTANTLKTLLTITGAGAIKYLGVGVVDTTSRTVRLKVTLDGVVVYDATSGAIANTTIGLSAVGAYNTINSAIFDSVVFNTSLLVEVASSLSETDTIGLRTVYETR